VGHTLGDLFRISSALLALGAGLISQAEAERFKALGYR